MAVRESQWVLEAETERSSLGSDTPLKRKPYKSPRLVCLGDIRSATLGGSPGTGDSGDAGFKCPRGGPGCFS